MEIPPSFAEAFRGEVKIGKRIRELAGNRLRLLCDQHDWLFADRIKNAESALTKMQVGMIRDLTRMVDLYAATIVVPTRAEISTAVERICGTYPGAKVNNKRRGNPATFVYDDLHIEVMLGSTAPGEPSAIRKRNFEIQIRTGLQFAWWRATHDRLYKGDSTDWRLQRVASQVRGNLEMLDGILADLDMGAGLLEGKSLDVDKDFKRIADWLGLWPASNQPTDVRHYVEAVEDLLKGALLPHAGAEHLLHTARGQSLIADADITPVQAITILIAELCGVAPLMRRGRRVGRRHAKRWLLITREMERASPVLLAVPTDRRSRLT